MSAVEYQGSNTKLEMGRSIINKFSSSLLVYGLDKGAGKELSIARWSSGKPIAVQREEHSTGDTRVPAERFLGFDHIPSYRISKI